MKLSTEQKTVADKMRGTGMLATRMCFTCNKGKLQLGGKLNKRLNIWTCRECHEKKEQVPA